MKETTDQEFYVIFTKNHTYGVCGYYHGPQRIADNTPKLFAQERFAQKTLNRMQDRDGWYGCIIKATLIPQKGYGV